MKSVYVIAAMMLSAAPVYAATDWSGGYIGAELGYGHADTSNAGGASGDNAIGGVYGGYNYDFGSYVLGGEFSYDTGDNTLSGGAGKLRETTRAGIRGGYDLGNMLVYGTTGVVRGKADLLTTKGYDYGYFVGAGIDHMLSSNVSVGGELIYDDFNNFNHSGVDLTNTTLSARVSFHF